MIRVTFRNREIEVSGHAGQAAVGKDTLCAAVSALVHALLHGLQVVASAQVEVSEDSSSGLLCARWKTEPPAARAILATIHGSLKELEGQHKDALEILGEPAILSAS